MKQKIMSGNQLMHQFIDTTVCVDCIFTALHEMQMRSSNENSVCPSVCLSVKCVNCDNPEEKSVQIFIQFSEKKNGCAGDPFYLKFWVNRPLLEQNRRF